MNKIHSLFQALVGFSLLLAVPWFASGSIAPADATRLRSLTPLFPYCPYPSLGQPETHNTELIDQTGGASHAVAVQGNYAYVGLGPRLVILDISNPARPHFISQTPVLPGVVRDVVLAGAYAYVAAGQAGIWVIDISNPGALAEVGFYDAMAEADSVAVFGHYLYVADTPDRLLRILDVATPNAPVQVGAYNTYTPGFGSPMNVRIFGSDAYVMTSRLIILSLANPIIPTLAGTPGGASLVFDVVVSGTRAYTASAYLSIWDITHPGAAVLLGQLDAPSHSYGGLDVSGHYAYLADFNYLRLYIVDVANPNTPATVGIVPIPADPQWPSDVTVHPPYAYLTDGNAGLRIINVGNPAVPFEASDYSPVVKVIENPSEITVGIHKYRLDASTGQWTLSIWDTSASPSVQVGSFTHYLPNPSCFPETGLAVGNNHAYVVDNFSGFHVLDVATPSTITEVSSLANEPAYAVAVAGQYAYLAGGGLHIVNVANPTAPREVASFHPAAEIDHVAVEGNQVHVTGGEVGAFDVWFVEPISTTIPVTGGNLTSAADQTTYVFAANTFTSSVIITHTAHFPGNIPSVSPLTAIGHAFEITGALSATTLPIQPAQPYTITLHYTEPEQGAAVENTLALYYWDGIQWTKEPTSVVDTTTNIIVASPNHFSLWAVLGATERVFFPMIMMKY